MEIEKTILENSNGSSNNFINNAANQNVYLIIEGERKESTIIAELEQIEEIKIIGGLYDAETGKVIFYE